MRGVDHGHAAALAGQVVGVVAEHVADHAHRVAHRHVRLGQPDRHARVARDFPGDAGQAGAGRVAHEAQALEAHRGLRQVDHVAAVRAHVAADLEVLPRQQHGDAMVADRPADQHLVAGADAVQPQVHAPAPQADAGGSQVQAAALAARQHLGIAGHDAYPGRAGRGGEAGDDAVQRGDLQAFLDEGVQRKVQRPRAADGEVVDGAVDRQRTDVAAGKFQRLDDEAVGGHVRFALAERDRRGVQRDVEAVGSCRFGKVPREHLGDQFAHVAPAVAVSQ